jgi:hypothetical protein
MRDGSFGWNNGSTRTEPVKYWSDPLLEGCTPPRVIVIDWTPSRGSARRVGVPSVVAPPVEAEGVESADTDNDVAMSSLMCVPPTPSSAADTKIVTTVRFD